MYTILGASGNVGSKVADALIKRGEKVRVVGRNSQRLDEFKKRGAELFIGHISDSAFLTKSFKNCKAALVMIPPDYNARSVEMHYQRLSESLYHALQQAGVHYVVNLSSFGAEFSDGTGPLRFLHAHEERLNRLEMANIVHLRPAFYMENLLSFIPSIRTHRLMQSCLKADLPIPMVASLDVARAATEKILLRNFSSHTVQTLLGPRDVSMAEVCQMLSDFCGERIQYQQLSRGDCEKGFVTGGFSEDVAHEFVEMYQAFNEGRIETQGIREISTMPTTRIEDFLRAFRAMFREDQEETAAPESKGEEVHH